MQKNSPTFKDTFIWLFAGRIDRVAIAFISVWAIGMGLNFAFGNPINLRTMFIGGATHLCVIAITLALKLQQRKT